MGDAQQVAGFENGVTNVGAHSVSIRRLLSDSIYLWACGEKTDDEHDEPTLPDKLIGWLILFMQGFAYTTLTILVGRAPSSDADTSGESGYLLPSVIGAMYLLVASTTHDLRAGYSLLVDGSCAAHRAFGIGLLVVYGAMMTAAVTVVVSTSDNSASVVLNAVTVLFIADLDEKALKFLSTVPQKWRLFWAIESFGISFALALAAIFSIGVSSPLFEENSKMLQTWPTSFLWVINPLAVTISSFLLSSNLQAVCEFCSEASASVDEPTVEVVVRRFFVRLLAVMKRVKAGVRGEPYFYMALAMWLAQAVARWVHFVRKAAPPVVFSFGPSAAKMYSFVLPHNKLVWLYTNLILAVGLTAKAWGLFQSRHEVVADIPKPRSASNVDGSGEERSRCGDSRVSSLLVGWGLSYWVYSLLMLLACSLNRNECGWKSATSVIVVAYTVLPFFLVTSVLMVADTNFLGTRFGAFVKPVVDRMQDRRRVEYWVMASVFLECLVLWVMYCELLNLN